jgi:hypothetical protein
MSYRIIKVMAMGLGNFFRSILGGRRSVSRSAEEFSEPMKYKEFTIQAAPLNTDRRFRTAGYISGEFNGEVKRVHFLRADQNVDLQVAIDHSLSKARQIIDEMGPKLLEKSRL